MAEPTQNLLQQLLTKFQAKEEEARTSNIKRYEQAMAIYDEIVQRYQPGGPFQAAALGQLGVQKTADVGAGAQRLISAGLFGTEAAAGLETGWEQAVGAPARLKLEDIMMQRLSQAQVGKAGFIERREDVYPDYGTIAQLAMQAGQAGQQPSPSFIGRKRARTINRPKGEAAMGGLDGKGREKKPRPTTPAATPTTGYRPPTGYQEAAAADLAERQRLLAEAKEKGTYPGAYQTSTTAPTASTAGGERWPTGQGPMKAGGPRMEFEYNPYTGARRNIRPLRRRGGAGGSW